MTHWLKPLTAAALGLILFSAQAQAGDLQSQRVDNRQARQSHRIDQGVGSGQITPVEQARLEQQQRHINRIEGRIEADGRVTGKEALRIEKAQDRASHKIRRTKHNRRTAG